MLHVWVNSGDNGSVEQFFAEIPSVGFVGKPDRSPVVPV